LCAVLSLAQSPEITCLNTFYDDLLSEPLKIAGGHLWVSERPGLGVTFHESVVARYRTDKAIEDRDKNGLWHQEHTVDVEHDYVPQDQRQ
jgi:hypothetical protein